MVVLALGDILSSPRVVHRRLDQLQPHPVYRTSRKSPTCSVKAFIEVNMATDRICLFWLWLVSSRGAYREWD